MSLPPILALDHVSSGYRAYLPPEFRTKDRKAGFGSQDPGFRGCPWDVGAEGAHNHHTRSNS